MSKLLPFVKIKQTIVFAANVYSAIRKYCREKGLSFNRFIRDAAREKCDRDGIPYEPYSEYEE
jgi:hypothetical protein